MSDNNRSPAAARRLSSSSKEELLGADEYIGDKDESSTFRKKIVQTRRISKANEETTANHPEVMQLPLEEIPEQESITYSPENDETEEEVGDDGVGRKSTGKRVRHVPNSRRTMSGNFEDVMESVVAAERRGRRAKRSNRSRAKSSKAPTRKSIPAKSKSRGQRPSRGRASRVRKSQAGAASRAKTAVSRKGNTRRRK